MERGGKMRTPLVSWENTLKEGKGISDVAGCKILLQKIWNNSDKD